MHLTTGEIPAFFGWEQRDSEESDVTNVAWLVMNELLLVRFIYENNAAGMLTGIMDSPAPHAF